MKILKMPSIPVLNICLLVGASVLGGCCTSTPRVEERTTVQAVVEQLEPGLNASWTEYHQADWHIGAAWIQDETRNEARVYVFRRVAGGQWVLKAKEQLTYAKDKLDHAVINYPDPVVMLVNTDGLLIHSIRIE